jgi:hypothetical protein
VIIAASKVRLKERRFETAVFVPSAIANRRSLKLSSNPGTVLLPWPKTNDPT